MEDGRKVYDDKIVEPIKDHSDEASGSSSGLFVNGKSYFNELDGNILADNEIREERIMVRIDIVARESEESRVKLKSKLKDGIQASEARVATQVDSVRDTIDYLGRTNVILNIGYFDVDTEPSVPIQDVTVDAPPSDNATAIP